MEKRKDTGAKIAAWSFMYAVEIVMVGGIGAAIHYLLGVPVVYVVMGWLAFLGGAHIKRLSEVVTTNAHALTTNAHALKAAAEALDAELGRQAEKITKLEARAQK